MKLSLLIPSRNMSSYIDKFFEYVYIDGIDENEFEVIVVDSSTDDSMNIFKKYELHNNFKLIHFDYKVGCGTARNIACKQAVGDYVYCMDIDDRFYDKNSLKSILGYNLKDDLYYCPFASSKNPEIRIFKTLTKEHISNTAIGVWTKLYKRELYIEFPDYMPEDVAAHFLLIDRCNTINYFDFPVYMYDNLNLTAISRTFDYMRTFPHNLIQLANTNEIEHMNLRQEYIVGAIKNLADMFDLRNKIKSQEVRSAWINKLQHEYMAIMSGLYIH